MNLFTYIKEHISIVTVAQEYVTIKKAGIYYKGPCPFHQEKDASFTISPHKEIFIASVVMQPETLFHLSPKLKDAIN